MHANDTVSFAFSEPYTFSQLHVLLKEITAKQPSCVSQTVLCKTLSGLDIPLLKITNNLESPDHKVYQYEYSAKVDGEIIKKSKPKNKKYVIVSGRVHPGETCGSWMMEGFLKFITSNDKVAISLRERMIFMVIPMLNPDGVIVGNYRSSISGHDLNRKFLNPEPRLHPNVCGLKSLVADIYKQGKYSKKGKYINPITAFMDFHAHSKKKCIFIYGPYFPLHNDKYIKMRVFSKLLSERTQMFRYYACKFRNEKSKLKAARLVLSSEFDIMNSFTVEASFYAFINKDRTTIEIKREYYECMGQHISCALYEYITLIETSKFERYIREQVKKIKKALLKKKKQKKRQSIIQSNEPTLLSNNYNPNEPAIQNEAGTPDNTDISDDPSKKLTAILDSIKEDVEKEAEMVNDQSDSSDSEEENQDEVKAMENNIINAVDNFNNIIKGSPNTRATTSAKLKTLQLMPQIDNHIIGNFSNVILANKSKLSNTQNTMSHFMTNTNANNGIECSPVKAWRYDNRKVFNQVHRSMNESFDEDAFRQNCKTPMKPYSLSKKIMNDTVHPYFSERPKSKSSIQEVRYAKERAANQRFLKKACNDSQEVPEIEIKGTKIKSKIDKNNCTSERRVFDAKGFQIIDALPNGAKRSLNAKKLFSHMKSVPKNMINESANSLSSVSPSPIKGRRLVSGSGQRTGLNYAVERNKSSCTNIAAVDCSPIGKQHTVKGEGYFIKPVLCKINKK